MKRDVLQLADLSQNFKHLCMTYYKLDCMHLVTAPGLTWQGCMKMVEQFLVLLTDGTDSIHAPYHFPQKSTSQNFLPPLLVQIISLYEGLDIFEELKR